ncbi:MAG: S-layer homology domain-containing protein, partial [Erysipelotrichaceae bacterium]|nr:S-layer homology domain-containing protein [Erysipelotrichaceae bacterium]
MKSLKTKIILLIAMALIAATATTKPETIHAESSYPDCTIWLGGGTTEGTPIKNGTVTVVVGGDGSGESFSSSKEDRVAFSVDWMSIITILYAPDEGFTYESPSIIGLKVNDDGTYTEVEINYIYEENYWFLLRDDMDYDIVRIDPIFHGKTYIDENIKHGTITAGTWNDGFVPLTITPDLGYKLKSLSAIDSAGEPVAVDETGFIMPEDRYVTVSAEFEVANVITSWDEFQSAMNEGGTIVLTQDITAEDADTVLIVPEGKEVVLELNGFTIDRNLDEARADGNVITVNGTLTINGPGTVTGGYNSNPGGCINTDVGVFIMNGGTITGNAAVNNEDDGQGQGGGVYVGNGVFTMNGGVITGNASSGNGGAVLVTQGSAFNISGNLNITDNDPTNVWLESEAKIQIAGTLTDASIGISMAVPGVFTNDLEGNGNRFHFFSDDSTYSIKINEDGEAYLKQTVNYSISIDSTIKNGTVVSDLAEAEEGETVTLTVTPETGFELDRLAVSQGSSPVEVTIAENNRYVIIMPAGDVIVSADFVPVTVPGTDAKKLSFGTEALKKDAGNSHETAQRLWYAGREWYVMGYDGTGTEILRRSGVITLLQYEVKETSRYAPDEHLNGYGGSELQDAVNSLLYGGSNQIFSEEEQAAMEPRNLTDPVMSDVLLWPLSPNEAAGIGDSSLRRDLNYNYWLRMKERSETSSTNYGRNAFIVSHFAGDIETNKVSMTNGVRTCFDLDMDSVLFTSKAQGGKDSGTVGADALKPVNVSTGNDWKVTLLDSSYGVTVTGTEATDTGVKVSYNVDCYGDNDYISAILVNKAGEITYYGRVAKPASSTGVVEINTEGLTKTSDKLYIFNEQYNGDYKTDLAGTPAEVALPERVKLVIHWTSIDGEDVMEPVIINHIPKGSNIYKALEKEGYETAAALFVKQGYGGLKWLTSEKFSAYSSYAEMSRKKINLFTAIDSDMVLYCPMVKYIEAVELTVEAPLCGTETSTDKPGSPWEDQTNPPVLTIPEGVNYVLNTEGNTNAGYWIDPVTGRGYSGPFTGGNEYLFDFSLTADYGWYFSADFENVTIDGGTFIENISGGATDSFTGAAKVVAEHVWGDTSYSWAEDNSTVTASRFCQQDPEHKETETVETTYEVTVEPGASLDGEGTYTAEFENPAFEEQTKTVTISALFMLYDHSLEIVAGKSASLTYTITTERHLVFSSFDESIATVDDNGKIKGIKAGKTIIKVSLENDENIYDTCEVHILFTDVSDSSKYFYDPVYWAFDNGITTGTSGTKFSPNDNCTRGQVVTFLWRAVGCPEPEGSNPF